MTVSGSIIYNKTMMSRYNTYTDDLLEFVATSINMGELSEYMDLSKECTDLQLLFDNIGRTYDIDCIYMLRYNDEKFACLLESTNLEQSVVNHLEQETDNFYKAFSFDGVYHFENLNNFHNEYTAVKSLHVSDSDPMVLLCVDVDLDYMNYLRRGFVYANVVMYGVIGILLTVCIIRTIDLRIIKPISSLENNARMFEEVCRNQSNPNAFVFRRPNLKYDDEIMSLSDTIESMSMYMRDYVKRLVVAKDKIEDIQGDLEEITTIAYRDGLTGVRNKLSYNQYKDKLNWDIMNLGATDVKFSIVMFDVNYLKRINDAYGHEFGDIYLKNCCEMICDVFKHSLVFRVGGDEFVVILENMDYKDRSSLIYKLKYLMQKSGKSADPWKRISMAVGYSDYSKESRDNVESVCRRADRNMYENKAEMKAVRKD